MYQHLRANFIREVSTVWRCHSFQIVFWGKKICLLSRGIHCILLSGNNSQKFNSNWINRITLKICKEYQRGQF